MYNAILRAITNQLDKEFPESDIDVNEITQGLTDKAFLVQMVEPIGRTKKNATLYEISQLIAIQYFRDQGIKETTEDFNEVAFRITECTEILNVKYDDFETKLRTEVVDSKVVDNVLTVTIRANDIYFRKPEGDRMEEADIEVISDGEQRN